MDRKAEKLVRGRSLQEALSGAQSLAERLRLLPSFIHLSEIVAAAHDRGTALGPLNTARILISEVGEVVLLGNAGEVAPPDPIYGAPETQSRRNYRDARADVFSLGAILYEILTGHTPFVWKQGTGGDAKIPESITVVEPEAPEELAAICRRCIRWDAGARYQSARHLADDLHRFLAGSISRTEPPPESDSTLKYKALFAAAVTAFIIALAGGIFAYQTAAKGRDEALERVEAAKVQLDSVQHDWQEQFDRVQARLADAEALNDKYEAARAAAEQARQQAEKELEEARRELAQKTAPSPEPAPAAAPAFTPEFAAPLPALQPPPPTPEPKAAPAPKPEPAPPTPEPKAAPAPKPEPAPPPPPAPVATQPAAQPPVPAPKAEPPTYSAGLTRDEFNKSVPGLLASLKEETQNGISHVVLGKPDPAQAAQIQKIGLKEGDIITRVNRNPIETVDQARRAFANVANDAGFSIRLTRGGQTGWVRVNFSDSRPEPQPAAKAETTPEPPPPQPQTETQAPDTPDVPGETEPESETPEPETE